MQLIEGRPLDEVIRDLRGDAELHSGNTTFDLRLKSTESPQPTVTRTTSATSRTREAYRTAARWNFALLPKLGDRSSVGVGIGSARATKFQHERAGHRL